MMQMRGRVVLMLSIALTILMTCLPARADKIDVTDLTSFFRAVALGSADGARIVKWDRAPKIRLETFAVDEQDDGRPLKLIETSPSHYEQVFRLISELRQLSGLPIRLIPRGLASGGDVIVSLVPRTHMRSLSFNGVPERVLRAVAGPGRCFFLIWPSRNSTINRAHIVINLNLEENHITHCFIEEIVQSMGLPHDSQLLSQTIFSESEKLTKLSEVDRLMIRALYDPRTIPGATWSDVEPVIGSIIVGAVR